MSKAKVEIHPPAGGAGHARQHVITSPLDHTSGATPGQILQADANGLPVDATNTDAQVALAVGLGHAQGTDVALGAVGVKNPPIDADKPLYRDSAAGDALVTSTWTQIKAFLKLYFDTLYSVIGLAHNRLHVITSPLDHTSGATPGRILQADANGLPVDATNTDAQVAAAVALAHTQGTDVALGAVGVKNPPINADKPLYRDSAAGDALVTSTWTQVKAFLKTYLDTLYAAITHAPSHGYLGADELSLLRLISQRAIPLLYKNWAEISGFTTVLGTGCAWTAGFPYGVLATSTTNNQEAIIYATAGFWQAYASYGYSWGMKVSIRNGTTQIVGIGFFTTPAGIDLLPPTSTTHQGHIGFIVDAAGNLWCSSGDTAHETQTDTGINITGTTDRFLSIYANNVGIYFYVNHVLRATHLLAGSYYPNATNCYFTTYLQNTDSSAKAIFIMPLSMFAQFAY